MRRRKNVRANVGLLTKTGNILKTVTPKRGGGIRPIHVIEESSAADLLVAAKDTFFKDSGSKTQLALADKNKEIIVDFTNLSGKHCYSYRYWLISS